jgi:hypothetical protein
VRGRALSLATSLLQWVLPPQDRDAILGDLIEEHRIRSAGSPIAATRWYWGQVCRSIPAVLVMGIRRDGWPLTVSIALAVYMFVGALNFVGTAVVARMFGARAESWGVSGLVVGLSAIAIGGYVAGRVRRGAATVLGVLVVIVAALLMAAPHDTAPFMYQFTFLILGPVAARLGSSFRVKALWRRLYTRALIGLMVLAVMVAPIIASHPQSPEQDARARLLAAKAALYDSNFRNDRPGLRAAVDETLKASADERLRPMALYYAAWGEWALSHSHLQAGDLGGAIASLTRSEQYARAGLALRPDDPEFIVMLADALIWRIVAEPQGMTARGPEVQALRARALDIAPDNPRGLMMDAGLLFNAPPERGGSREKGLARWTHAIDLLEREATLPARDDLRPDWGLALSYAWVCDLYLGMRPRQIENAQAAANKALHLRPDFWYVKDVVMPRLQ